MLSKTIDNYGGPFVSESVASNHETQISDTKANRFLEDVAAMTRTAPRVWVEFKTNATTSPVAADITHAAVWGSGDANKPTVTRTAAGKYTVTWASTYTDALGTVETVSFRFASCPIVRSGTGLHYTATVDSLTANSVELRVWDDASPPVVSDLGGTAYVCLSLA